MTTETGTTGMAGLSPRRDEFGQPAPCECGHDWAPVGGHRNAGACCGADSYGCRCACKSYVECSDWAELFGHDSDVGECELIEVGE